jgi:integrase
LDQPTGPAPDFLDEGVVGIRELAMQMASDKGYSQSLRKKLMYTARRWIELHGDIPIPKWKKAHLSAFSDALKGLPITRQDRVHSLPIQEAIAVAKAENLDTMGEKMRQTRVDHMKSMATYAMDQLGLIEADPFGRFVIIKQKKKHSEEAEKDTIGYTPAQSRLIIAHCQESFHEDTLDRWAPIVALYTGMRREEIGQMFVSDVEDWGNGLTFSITDKGEYQSVKNKHSLRKIPVPAELLDMGFGEFVARRRQVGGTMLFMENFTDNKTKAKTLREVQVSGQGNYTETYGERFSRYVRKPLGLTDHGHNFHSTRHSWTTSARRAGINPDIRRLIAGRLDDVDVKLDPNEAKVDPVEADYGRADLLSEKKEALIAVGRFVILD